MGAQFSREPCIQNQSNRLCLCGRCLLRWVWSPELHALPPLTRHQILLQGLARIPPHLRDQIPLEGVASYWRSRVSPDIELDEIGCLAHDAVASSSPSQGGYGGTNRLERSLISRIRSSWRGQRSEAGDPSASTSAVAMNSLPPIRTSRRMSDSPSFLEPSSPSSPLVSSPDSAASFVSALEDEYITLDDPDSRDEAYDNGTSSSSSGISTPSSQALQPRPRFIGFSSPPASISDSGSPPNAGVSSPSASAASLPRATSASSGIQFANVDDNDCLDYIDLVATACLRAVPSLHPPVGADEFFDAAESPVRPLSPRAGEPPSSDAAQTNADVQYPPAAVTAYHQIPWSVRENITNIEEATDLVMETAAKAAVRRRAVLHEAMNEIIAELAVFYEAIVPPMLTKEQIDKIPCETYLMSVHSPVETIFCPICICEMQDGDEFRKLPCAHIAHRCCIDRWLAAQGSCPLCRCVVPMVEDAD